MNEDESVNDNFSLWNFHRIDLLCGFKWDLGFEIVEDILGDSKAD